MRYLSAVASLILLTGCASTAGDEGEAPVEASSAENTAETVVEEEPAYEPPETYKPSKDDFGVKVRVTSQACFGSAGCNVGYKVSLAWRGPAAAPKLDSKYDVTYRITGSDYGPALETMTVYPGLRYDVPYEVSTSTAHPGAKLVGQVVGLQKAY